jgi:hypothetical protein
MKNKIGMLLMEAGVSYNKQRLHKAGYFRELLATNPDIVGKSEKSLPVLDFSGKRVCQALRRMVLRKDKVEVGNCR